MAVRDDHQGGFPPASGDGHPKILPAAYIAPATLMLVTADRAAAQSRCTEVDLDLDNTTAPDVTVQYNDNAGSQSEVIVAGDA